MDITPDEIMVVCISRQLRDGDVVAQGLATPLVAAGYLLARHTHAPHLYFASAIGQGICRHPAPLSLSQVEIALAGPFAVKYRLCSGGSRNPAISATKRILPPGQVDAHGNINNIAFGKDYQHPRLRLPGTGGIPDVTTFLNDIYLYVPRHSRVTFVSRLDFCAGLGHNDARTQGKGPAYLISDLGQFDYENGQMRLVSYHPGCSIDGIQNHTGFPLAIAPDVMETPAPTAEEIDILRNEIDPAGIRKLETLSGAARRELIHTILANGG